MRLKEKYQKEVISDMVERFRKRNKMAVPKIEKVVVNVGFGRMISGKSADEQKKIHEIILDNLSQITGQKPQLTLAKKSIAAFKTRQGLPLGAKITLRGQKMYDFLDRLIHIALPRSRDFRGVDASSFDKKGNLTIGIKEQITFPEILPEKAKIIFGLEITVTTTAQEKEEGIEFLKLMGFPIKKE